MNTPPVLTLHIVLPGADEATILERRDEILGDLVTSGKLTVALTTAGEAILVDSAAVERESIPLAAAVTALASLGGHAPGWPRRRDPDPEPDEGTCSACLRLIRRTGPPTRWYAVGAGLAAGPYHCDSTPDGLHVPGAIPTGGAR